MIACALDRTINITYLEASLEQVWLAVATIEGSNRYLTDVASTSTGSHSAPQVGDKYTLFYGDIVNETTVTHCDRLKLFALSDSYRSMAPDGSIDPFQVKTCFILEPYEQFVKLTLEVTGFSENTFGQWFRECLEMGWRRSLMNLKSVLELGLDLRTELFSFPRLGVTNCTVNEEQSCETGVAVGGGNYLLQVFPGGPADHGGLQAGDVVIAFDDVPVRDYAEFVRVISTYYSWKEPVRISYVREGKGLELSVDLSIDSVFTGLIEGNDTSQIAEREKRVRLAKRRVAPK
jgi:hypothetical protein